MLTISGAAGGNSQTPQVGNSVGSIQDPISKSIQKQIANAQKRLQELSANQDLSMEEKMKKRQEIQQEITNLNQQLRQHQIEQRRERQEKAREAAKDNASKNQNPANAKKQAGNTGFSKAGMQAMVSADVSQKQAQELGGVVTRMEGQAHVLAGEIKQDKNRGVNVEKKESELAKLENRIEKATDSQISMLADAKKEMDRAAESDKDVGKEEESKRNEINEEDKRQDKAHKGEKPWEEERPDGYGPVDIRL